MKMTAHPYHKQTAKDQKENQLKLEKQQDRHIYLSIATIIFSLSILTIYCIYLNVVKIGNFSTKLLFYDTFNNSTTGNTILTSGRWSLATAENDPSSSISHWNYSLYSLFKLAYAPADYSIDSRQSIDDVLIHTDPTINDAASYIIAMRVNPQNDNPIGIVFRYQDKDNFYAYTMSKLRQSNIITYALYKKENGIMELLSSKIDTKEINYTNQKVILYLLANGGSITTYANTTQQLNLLDYTFPKGGVGIYALPQTSAYIDQFKVID